MKYLLTREDASVFKEQIKEFIPVSEFVKGKSLTMITTVYFDTVDHTYYRQALADPTHNTKVRAREYYYFNSELIEHATTLNELYEHSPKLFLEIKRRQGDQSSKQRVAIHKEELIKLNQNPQLVQRYLDKVMSENPESENFQDVLYEISTHKIRPCAAAHYMRNAFEMDGLRISLDYNLSYHNLSQARYNQSFHWRKEALEEPLSQREDVILEVKSTHQWPDWLSDILAQQEAVKFSKFTHCLKEVVGV